MIRIMQSRNTMYNTGNSKQLFPTRLVKLCPLHPEPTFLWLEIRLFSISRLGKTTLSSDDHERCSKDYTQRVLGRDPNAMSEGIRQQQRRATDLHAVLWPSSLPGNVVLQTHARVHTLLLHPHFPSSKGYTRTVLTTHS